MSHNIYVAKSCGGGWKSVAKWGRLLWENLFQIQCTLLVVIVAMCLPLVIVYVGFHVLILYDWFMGDDVFVHIAFLGW